MVVGVPVVSLPSCAGMQQRHQQAGGQTGSIYVTDYRDFGDGLQPVRTASLAITKLYLRGSSPPTQNGAVLSDGHGLEYRLGSVIPMTA